MFRALERRARRLAEQRVDARLRAIEAGLSGGLPHGVAIGREDGRIIVSGRGLRRRFVTEAMLRWSGRAG